jgi:uncharacterized protein (DUF4415 family)
MTAELNVDELSDFERSLMRAVLQAENGEGIVHTPAEIEARNRARGRPVQEEKKQAVKLRLDADVLKALRGTGKGWQTRVNEQMRAALKLSGLLA